MGQLGRVAGLANESTAVFLAIEGAGPGDLHGHDAVQLRIAGAVDRAKCALPHRLDQLELANSWQFLGGPGLGAIRIQSEGATARWADNVVLFEITSDLDEIAAMRAIELIRTEGLAPFALPCRLANRFVLEDRENGLLRIGEAFEIVVGRGRLAVAMEQFHFERQEFMEQDRAGGLLLVRQERLNVRFLASFERPFESDAGRIDPARQFERQLVELRLSHYAYFLV